MQIVEQTAVDHEFGDDKDGLADGAHGIKLDQVVVLQFLSIATNHIGVRSSCRAQTKSKRDGTMRVGGGVD